MGVPNFERSGVTAAQRTAQPRTDGLGRVRITVYLILALAATLRAIYQIVAKFDEAPVAYSLSLASGVVYIIATVALMRRTCMAKRGSSACQHCASSYEFKSVHVGYGLK